MVYKVLSIIASILLSLTGVVLVACLAYTLGAPLLEAGVNGVKASLKDSLTSAAGAVGLDAGAIAGDWRAQVGDLFASVANTTGTGAAAPTATGDFVDQAQGEAYLRWKDVVGDPVGSVLAGSGVSATVLQGIAGGSTSANDVLASLDETALATIYANAARYASNVSAAEVSSILPDNVRAQMWEANSAAQGFAAAVQQLVESARSFKAGNVGALLGLAGEANSAMNGVTTINACLTNAENLLRG